MIDQEKYGDRLWIDVVTPDANELTRVAGKNSGVGGLHLLTHCKTQLSSGNDALHVHRRAPHVMLVYHSP